MFLAGNEKDMNETYVTSLYVRTRTRSKKGRVTSAQDSYLVELRSTWSRGQIRNLNTVPTSALYGINNRDCETGNKNKNYAHHSWLMVEPISSYFMNTTVSIYSGITIRANSVWLSHLWICVIARFVVTQSRSSSLLLDRLRFLPDWDGLFL